MNSMSDAVFSTSNITLYISDHLCREEFYDDLKASGYSIVSFAHDKKGWSDSDGTGVYLIDEKLLIQEFLGLLDIFFLAPDLRPVIVIGEQITRDYLASLFKDRPFYYLNRPVNLKQINDTIRLCAEASEKGRLAKQFERELWRAQREIEVLHSIGMALSSEKDPDRLLNLILSKSREISESDAGSLYLVESEKNLRFKLTQNASLDWQVSQNLLMPIDENSISGYVAHMGQPVNLLDAYFIPDSFRFTFNRSFDEKSGYRTRSMLAVPMKNQAGEVLGVIQLINKRRDFESHRPGQALKEENVVPYTRKDLDLLSSLASQAAIALENSKLYQDIKNLFEGFVRASIVAIEARDPTTCGHSERVAALTTAFAEKVDSISEGPLADIHFNDLRLTEIRYASLLHDFGKVGVREEVLIKAKKLFPHELNILRNRYRYIRKSLEADHYKSLLEFAIANGLERFASMRPALEANFQSQLDEIDEILKFLVASNEPTVLEEGNFQRLIEIAKRRHVDYRGEETEYLSEREMHVLSIRKGSLSETERLEIESHVTHTFNFLSKIPWTKPLHRVPDIAFAHHEKLNARGYPNHLEGNQIPIESRLMTICDIYDALTAQDRPYKKAMPREKAFDIMYNEVKQGLLSSDLMDVFVHGGVFKVIENKTFRT
ncbi:MAG: GAF domain-containing protein [Candidatus Riflebacteria bacterium]|nr:GAF domain-containing protein [Candidatus Riflebacteria bacterium]